MQLNKLREVGRLHTFGRTFAAVAARAGGRVVVAPAGLAWEEVSASDLSRAPQVPASVEEAMRWAMLFDDIFECDSTTTVLVTLAEDSDDVETMVLSGPDHDHRPAIRAVAALLSASAKAPEMTPANDNAPKPKRFAAVDAETLLSMEFAPVKYVVPGFVAEGLTILGGRPKLGKSWLSLGFGIGVASGGKVLGADCEQGDVLYLALEDNQRRLQDRLRLVLPRFRRPDMSRLSLQTEAPKVGAGLIEMLDAWRKSVSDPRLIIIDTLAIVRPPKKGNQDSYSADYEALSPLQRFASEHRLAVVVVTHVRKMEASDPLEMISGTNGLTGAADSIMVLDRGADGCKLYGRGRDIEEVEKALKFDAGVWSVLGNVDDVKRSDERKQIIDVLVEAGEPMKPADIATATGLKPVNVRHLLGKMVAAGEAEKTGYGLYLPCSHRSHRSQLESPEINYTSQCNSLAECEGCEHCEQGGEEPLTLEVAA